MGAKNLSESSEKEPEEGRPPRSAATKSHGDHMVTRSGTAKDWRGSSGPLSTNAKKEADGPLRNGTAKDWREAAATDATDDTEDASSASGESSKQQKGTETMRGGPSRG